jgi:hypothetical protein
MTRATVKSIGAVALPTVELEVAEWEGSVVLRALTRAQVREAREAATVEGVLDADTYDMAIAALGFAEPDLVAEVGLDEAIRLLRAQPMSLIGKLLREILAVSGLGSGAPFRRGAADDAGRRNLSGASDSP